ncbi:Glycosyltransferase [Candidatus Syntrophocurvum alkaliphilum]|uniref:Glycosyltransferase n=1 Tax=Candidatus Syntrophocurvum alkaliphilum TaxID=2293317 RepID=A0A6I6DKM0_9FIRM|nr:glycosyltransferase family 4 protein [Candidatus Syntrophocurvum alkaliphilum]QGU00490.1 Glycosyltransferase [Candidatus Syntrophocurvum alkaliphilum]
MNKTKVLHLIGGGEIGGAEELVLTIMKLLDKEKYDPHLICLCHGPFVELAKKEGLKASTIPMKHKLDLSTINPIKEYLVKNKIDIVHTHGVRANLVARIAAHKEGLPVATTFHSALRYDYNNKITSIFAKRLTMLTNKHTNKFIAISNSIKDEIMAMNVPANKIKVIHSGLDTAKFTSNTPKEKVQKELEINPQNKTITMVARLHPVKGHEYFIRAAKEVIEKNINAQFLIIGEGELRSELEQLINKLNLDKNIIMPGYYSKIEDIYRISDIICVPSVMEGLGLVVLEAMYFKTPVIASNVGGIPEIIEDGKDGILTPPQDYKALADAIIKLCQNEKLSQTIAQNATQKINNFTVQNMTREVEIIYDELTE